jgi:hypothetical protein
MTSLPNIAHPNLRFGSQHDRFTCTPSHAQRNPLLFLSFLVPPFRLLSTVIQKLRNGFVFFIGGSLGL